MATEIKKTTTVFSNALSVHVDAVKPIADKQYLLGVTHFGEGKNNDFSCDVHLKGHNPPGIGDNILLLNFVPQNKVSDGEGGLQDAHQLLVNGRSQWVSIGPNQSVNSFVAHGRLGGDAEHLEGSNSNGDWKMTTFSIYVSYWDSTLKSVQDFFIKTIHSRVHIPGLDAGNKVIVRGQLTSSSYKGKDYFNLRSYEVNYGARSMANTKQ